MKMIIFIDPSERIIGADKHGNVKIVQYLEQEYGIVTFGQREKNQHK